MVSQWNAYEFDENGHVNSDPNKIYSKDQQMELVDGNSVNYAEKSGDSHERLDSNVVKTFDSEVRKKVSNKWTSPKTDDSLDDYYNQKESVDKANQKLE